MLALAALLLVAACGDEVRDGSNRDRDPEPAPKPTVVPAADGRVTTYGPTLVLDDGEGAELCLGGVAESLPPQCGGPPLVGWDWAEHQGDFEQRGGVRWGEFMVTGTFDGTSITPTEVVRGRDVEPPAMPPDDDGSQTPCPEPAGGWRVLDPALTTQDTMQETFARAEKLDGYADSWLDQSLNPVSEEELTPENVDELNDPTLLIINVRVSGDPEAAEQALRAAWGGSLCVSRAQRTDAELASIQDEVSDLPGFTSSDHGRDVVNVSVAYDDGSLQAWADATYGEGTVFVFSALQDVGSGG